VIPGGNPAECGPLSRCDEQEQQMLRLEPRRSNARRMCQEPIATDIDL
jgi:hypothetical protein